MYNVILPTYNEAKNIVPLIRMIDDTFFTVGKQYKIIVVDDDSSDNTSGIVKALNSRAITVIDRPGKLGLGSAYESALKYCDGDYTVIMDADLQHDPEDIRKMIAFEGYDIVSGTRYSKGGRVAGWGFERCLASATANNIAKFVLGLSTTDLTGSFRCYKTTVLKDLVKLAACRGFGFQMEAIARAEYKKYKITEVPIVFHDRSAGESKMSYKEILNFLFTVFYLYLII